jgi:hypothetical protein
MPSVFIPSKLMLFKALGDQMTCSSLWISPVPNFSTAAAGEQNSNPPQGHASLAAA